MIYLHILGMIILSFYATTKRLTGKRLRDIILNVPQITRPLDGRVPSVKEVYKDTPESIYIYKKATMWFIIGEGLYFVIGGWIFLVFDYGIYTKIFIGLAFYYIPAFIVKLFYGGRA